MHAAGQAAEKVFKALAFIAKIVKLARDVFVDVFIAQPCNGLVIDALVAAHGGDFARDLLQNFVHKRAHLGRGEACRLMRLCLERVLHEVSKAAGRKFIYPRGRKAQFIAVKRPDRCARKAAAAAVCLCFKRAQALRLVPGEKLGRACRARSAAVQRLRCKLQRRGGGVKASHINVKLASFNSEHGLRAVYYKRRALLRARAVGERIAKTQAVRRQRQAVVHNGKRAPQLAVADAAEVNVHLKQSAPLVGRKNAGVRFRAGDALIRCAEDDQMFYIAAAHAIHFAGRHAVERGRDRSDIVAREHKRKQAAEIFRIRRSVAEHCRALLERADRYIPQLGVFLRRGGPAVFFQLLGTHLELIGKVQILKKACQSLCLSCRRRGGSGIFGKAHKRPARRFAQKIYVLKRLLGRLVRLLAVALRVQPPIFGSCPRRAVQLPHENVVFKLVALVCIQSAEARAQIVEHIVGLPSAEDDLIRRLDKHRHRF